MRALVLSALLFIAFPTLAAAPLTFEEVDTDGDGLISADEAASVEGLNFDDADADHDGTLSVDEYEIAVENLAPLPEEDQTGDGQSAETEPAEPAEPAKPAEAAKPAVTTKPAPPSGQAPAHHAPTPVPAKPASGNGSHTPTPAPKSPAAKP